MKATVETTYLELPAATEVGRPARERPAYELQKLQRQTPEFVRFLFAAVGHLWRWSSRLAWTYAQWQEHFAGDGVEIWIAYLGGAPAGYFELNRSADGSVELASFGVVPDCIGIGMGSHLLCDAIERARGLGNGRVWVHTCNNDHPQAVANYRKRGFQIYNVAIAEEEVPDSTEPWPGAETAADGVAGSPSP
jgi:ribosomal protein S18 acetylase RimI-like enzyme